MEHEITAIKRSFAKVGLTEETLKFIYIVVSKRINTRFFQMNGKTPGNPPR